MSDEILRCDKVMLDGGPAYFFQTRFDYGEGVTSDATIGVYGHEMVDPEDLAEAKSLLILRAPAEKQRMATSPSSTEVPSVVGPVVLP